MATLLRRTLLAAVLLGGLAPALASGGRDWPAAGAFSGAYDIHVGGIWVGEVTAQSVADDGVYLAEATFRTAGLVAFFVDERWRGQTEGRVLGGELVPLRYFSRQIRSKGDKLREVTFENGEPVAVSANPPTEERPWSIDPADQPAAVDPATAVVSILAPGPSAALCDRRIEVYDGKHRFAFDIGRPARDGDGLACQGTYIRLAGYKPEKMGKDATRPFSLHLEPVDEGLWQVARVTTPTPLGLAAMRPRD